MKRQHYTFLLLFAFVGFVSAQQRKKISNLSSDNDVRALLFNQKELVFNMEEEDFINSDIEQDSIKFLSLKNCVFPKISFTGTISKPVLQLNISKKCNGKSVKINTYTLNAFLIDSEIDTLEFANCAIEQLNIQKINTDYINLQESEVIKQFYISSNTFTNIIDLRGFRIDNASTLSTIAVSRKDKSPTTILFDFSTKFNNLDIDLSKYNLVLDESCSDCNNKNSYFTFFNNQLANYKESGQESNYLTLYYIYRKWMVKDDSYFSKIFNYYIPREFYGFGLKKILIIRATFVLLFLAFLLFLCTHNPILKTYDFEMKNKKLSNNKTINHLYVSFVLTVIVFFALNLDYKKIDFKNITGLTSLLLIFTTGLLCYAFLANFIFTFK